MNTQSTSAAADQSVLAGPSVAVAQRMEEMDAQMLQMAETQAQESAQWLEEHASSEQEPPAPPPAANYPGLFNIDNHEWSAAETNYLISGTLLGQTIEQISAFFANHDGFFSWPASYCQQRIAYLSASEVHLPRDWSVPNTIQNSPYIEQLSEDEEAELRIFVHTGKIHTDYVFRDYRTHQWLRLACHELYQQRTNQRELWLAKFKTAWDASTYRRSGMPDRWLQWRQESTERRERLEAAQRQYWVTDEEIAGEDDPTR